MLLFSWPSKDSLSGSPSSKAEFYHKLLLPCYPLLQQGPLRGRDQGIPYVLGAHRACTALGSMLVSCSACPLPPRPLLLPAQCLILLRVLWSARVLALATTLTS